MNRLLVAIFVLLSVVGAAPANAETDCPSSPDAIYPWVAGMQGDTVEIWRQAGQKASACGMGDAFAQLADAKALAAETVVSEPAQLDGVWVSTNWYSFAMGVVIPFAEVLTIEDGAVEQRLWRWGFDSEATEQLTMPDAYSVRSASARLKAPSQAAPVAFADVETVEKLPARLHLAQEQERFGIIFEVIYPRLNRVTELRINEDALLLVTGNRTVHSYRRYSRDEFLKAHALIVGGEISANIWFHCMLKGVAGQGGTLDYGYVAGHMQTIMELGLNRYALMRKAMAGGISAEEKAELTGQIRQSMDKAIGLMRDEKIQKFLETVTSTKNPRPVCMTPP